jgi:proline iminopeptidase
VQIVYFDHRGNGRSSGVDPEHWTLAQWGDDVKGLCDALGELGLADHLGGRRR